MQQWNLRRRLPGGGDRVGQLTFFIEQVAQSTLHPSGFDDEYHRSRYFIEERARLVNEERHPALHAVEELAGRESVERGPTPGHAVDHALGVATRLFAQEPFARRCHDGLVEVVQRAL